MFFFESSIGSTLELLVSSSNVESFKHSRFLYPTFRVASRVFSGIVKIACTIHDKYKDLKILDSCDRYLCNVLLTCSVYSNQCRIYSVSLLEDTGRQI